MDGRFDCLCLEALCHGDFTLPFPVRTAVTSHLIPSFYNNTRIRHNKPVLLLSSDNLAAMI